MVAEPTMAIPDGGRSASAISVAVRVATAAKLAATTAAATNRGMGVAAAGPGGEEEEETRKQQAKRHRKYEKMSESNDSEKQSVKHQVGAMYRSVIAQEKVVEHLRALDSQDLTEDQAQNNKDLLEDLVEGIKYLEVAYDYDWDAAKVFREMREANPSSIVLKAVTEAKKHKAAVKKEPEDKKKKKGDVNNNGGGQAAPW